MATFVVNTLIDENNGLDVGNISLRDAINAANTTSEVDEIIFDINPGTITLLYGELLITQSLIINGLGADILTIDADQRSRVFNIDDDNNSADQTIILAGLTLTGGNIDDDGGGIRSVENLIVQDSIISGNTTVGVDNDGGGISSEGGNLKVLNSTISENSTNGSDSQGGGIYSGRFGELILERSAIINNFTTGAVVADGGGIFNRANSFLLTKSTVDGNFIIGRDSDGGGFHHLFGDLTIIDSTISNNSTSGNSSGGGGFVTNQSETIVRNSTISGNTTADEGGGGIWNIAAPLNISNSTITNNTSSLSKGDGILNFNAAETTVVSSIIAGNNNEDLGTNQYSLITSFVSQGNNLIGTGNVTTVFNQQGDQVIGASDPGLAPLANNGGPTETHSLKTDSLAIDSGSNPLALVTDQRGEGFDRVANGQADIGAFETQVVTDNAFFFSGSGDTSVGNLTFADEDIVYFDGTDFRIVFDGSDLLARNVRIAAFDIISDSEILMVFSRPTNVPGIGTVENTDVVKFTANGTLGAATAGDFELYMDGSDIGLDTGGEKIDALTRMGETLLFSTRGDADVAGMTAKEQDLLLFNPNTLGENTSGTVSLYLDGSDIGLSRTAEDVNAVALRGNQLLISTQDKVKAPGIKGLDEDVLAFTPTATGSNSAGQFENNIFFDGSMVGFRGDIIGLDFNIG